MHQVRILCVHDFSILNIYFLEPKLCGEIFDNDDDARYEDGWVTIYDGASLGQVHHLSEYDPIYVGNDRLSAIHAYGGKEFWTFFKNKGVK